MDRKGKHNTAKIIVSSIATIIGAISVILKIYSHIGMILFSFGGVILALSLEARKKEITSDELTEWISCKAAVVVALFADLYYYGKINKNLGS